MTDTWLGPATGGVHWCFRLAPVDGAKPGSWGHFLVRPDETDRHFAQGLDRGHGWRATMSICCESREQAERLCAFALEYLAGSYVAVAEVQPAAAPPPPPTRPPLHAVVH